MSDHTARQRLQNMYITPSDICSAYDYSAIGSRITNIIEFSRELEAAIAEHDFTKDRVPGQGFIALPGAVPYVSAGVGRPLQDPLCYVLRLYRGKVSAFLRREHAAPVESCHVVVYTKEAYLNDPDVTTEEAARVAANILHGREVTHVLVAVLAAAGPTSQLGAHRFTANLAGGNHEAQLWTADEIRAKARAIMAYDQDWVTVADPEDG